MIIFSAQHFYQLGYLFILCLQACCLKLHCLPNISRNFNKPYSFTLYIFALFPQHFTFSEQ